MRIMPCCAVVSGCSASTPLRSRIRPGNPTSRREWRACMLTAGTSAIPPCTRCSTNRAVLSMPPCWQCQPRGRTAEVTATTTSGRARRFSHRSIRTPTCSPFQCSLARPGPSSPSRRTWRWRFHPRCLPRQVNEMVSASCAPASPPPTCHCVLYHRLLQSLAGKSRRECVKCREGFFLWRTP